MAAAAGLGLLSFGGGILSAIGQSRAAGAQADALEAQAREILIQSYSEAARERRQSRRAIGEQRAQVAASGIRVEGSQGDLLLSNAVELELGTLARERYARARAELLMGQAEDIDDGRTLGLVSGILGAAGGGAATAATAGGY